MILRVVAVFVLLSLGSLVSADTYEYKWGQPGAPDPGWSDTTSEACSKLGLTVVPGLYYYGPYYLKDEESNTQYEVTCVDTYGKTSWVRLYCFRYDGSHNLIDSTLGECGPPRCVPCIGRASAPGTSVGVIGNPVEMQSRVKRQRDIDWQSPLDPRFQIARSYRSNGDLYVGYNANISDLAHAGVWRTEFNDFFHYDNVTDKHIYYRNDGSRFFFANDGSYTPIGDSLDISVTYVDLGYYNKRLVVEDGTGVVRKFDAQDVWDRPLSEIIWPDGYQITIVRASGVISEVHDNRGQKAVYTWSTAAAPGSSRELLSFIEIDTNFQGTFDPEVRLDYTYAANARHSDVPPIVEVTRTDLATQQSELVDRYDYAIGPIGDTGQSGYYFPLLLTSIQDGRLDGTGQPFDYATFTYSMPAIIGTSMPRFDYLDGVTFRGVESSSHFGGADYYAVTGSGFTGPLGRQETHVFAEHSHDMEATSVTGTATQNAAGTSFSNSFTAPSGQPDGYLYEQIGRNGARTVYTRDAEGRVLTKTEDADGTPRVTSYTWPTSGLRKPLTRTTSELAETFTYDGDDLLTQYSQEDVLSGSPNLNEIRTWTYTYTTLASDLKVLTSIDGPGDSGLGIDDVTSYTYDSEGRVTSVTDPNGLVTQVLAFDALGLPSLVQDPQGFEWAFSYDINGRLLSAVFQPGALDETSTFTYDVVGQMLTSTDSLGRTWSYTYDEARRLAAITSPAGETMTFEHDAMGNVTRTEYADGAAVLTYYGETRFDELGRLLKVLGANGQITEFTHDVEDNLATVTDAQSLTTTNTYDVLNRLTDIADRASYTTTMDHNESDQLTLYSDPRGIDTTFSYNGFGEVVSEVSADRGTLSYTYDERGLVSSFTDGRGTVTNYTYDDGGRVLSKTFPSDSALNQSFTYHTSGVNAGHLYTVTDRTGQSQQWYETVRGNIDRDWRTIDGIIYKMKYLTQQEGQFTRMHYPSGAKLRYFYDADGQLTKLVWEGINPSTGSLLPQKTIIDNMTYLPFGPMTGAVLGDGGVFSATYDSSYRLTNLTDTVGASALRDTDYSWTTRDNLASVTDNLVSAQSETYGYDAREMLSSADGPWGEFDYAYDGSGNRTSLTDTVLGTPLVDSYSYPTTSNRLQSVTFGAGGSRGLTYDAAGNVTGDTRSGQAYVYTYDAASRLTSVSVGGALQAEYEYNYLGQQVIRRLIQSGQTIHSIHDIWGHRIAEYDYNTSTGTSSLIREYLWAGDQMIAIFEGGQLYYVRSDHIGRPLFAADSTGAVVWEASYLPFGGIQASTGANTDLRFPGQWFQSEAGLYQNWMRDYDPTLGRYLEADPLGLIDGASVYGYARQSPGRWTDPRGECLEDFCIVEGAILLDWAFGGLSLGGTIGGVGTAIGITTGIVAMSTPTTPGIGTLVESQTDTENCPPDRCEMAISDAQRAYNDLVRKRIPQYLSGGTRGPDANHYETILQKQIRLRDAIRRIRIYCNPLPPQLPEWERIANLEIKPWH